ncbi:MAG TPA: O-antigen ligase family protein, partial [Candidatus Nanoarchaeia archaeon]|nr:O-antigen ligase family protein [Candidatus Nanoarchaeia archaeon]
MKSNNILPHIIIAGLLGALFIPFVVADTQLFPYISGKGFVFRILVEILLGIWVGGMFFDASLRPKITWLTWSVLALTVVTILADIFGHSFYHSFWSNYERMDGLITTLHLAAYFFIASSVLSTRARWKVFFNVSVVASVIMAIYAFNQLSGRIQINQGGVRVDGTFGNATYLAVYMLLNIFITLFLALGVSQSVEKGKQWYLYCWYGLALVCQLIPLYYTATRGAILGLIGGLILTSAVIALFEKNRPGIRKSAIGVLVLVIIVVGGFFIIRDSSFVTSSQTLSRFSSISIQSINNQGRRYVWPMAWQGFLDRPILGWGQENFNYVFNKYYDPRMYNQEPWFDRAHNIVLDWLVTAGLLGFLSYMSLFGAALYLLWKNETYSIGEKAVLLGLLSSYFFQNLFVFDNLISYMYFFAILAFIHSESSRNKSEPAWLTRIATPTVGRVVAATCVVMVVALIYGLNVKQIGASKNIINGLSFSKNTAEQSLDYFQRVFDANTFASGEALDQLASQFATFTSQGVAQPTRERYVKMTVENLEKQINRYPDDARYLLTMGSLRGRMGDNEASLSYLGRALKESPKKQRIYYEIGLVHLNTAQYLKAVEAFKTAYDLDTSSEESKILYIISLLYNKDLKTANTLIAELTKKPEFFDERIVSALVNTNNTGE